MWLQLLIAVFVLLAGLLAGVLFAVETAIVPTIRALAPEPWVNVHILLDRRFDPMMPRINKVALAIGAVLVIFTPGIGAKIAFGVAAICIIGVAYVSEAYNVRMNKKIAAWDLTDLPHDWTAMRSRWASANRVRTLIAIAGFVATITAVALAGG